MYREKHKSSSKSAADSLPGSCEARLDDNKPVASYQQACCKLILKFIHNLDASFFQQLVASQQISSCDQV